MNRQSYELLHPEYMFIPKTGGEGAINDGDGTLYGCDQDWYRIEWRRRAGCGPVAATNILFYLQKKYGVDAIPYESGNIEEALAAMNDVFTFVRPKRRGLHTVRRFVKGMCIFGRKYGLSIKYNYLNVPPRSDIRPTISEVVNFIQNGLNNDVPVAFLNLHAGEVEDQLDSWHWVTVIGLTKTGANTDVWPADGADIRVADVTADEIVGAADGVDIRVADVTADAEAGAADGAYSHAPYNGEDAYSHASYNGEDADSRVLLRYYDQSKSLEVDLGRWLSTTERGGGFAYFCAPSPRNP